MKFKVLNPLPVDKEGFYIEIEFMHGDADGDTFETVGPFTTKHFEEAGEFVTFIEAVIDGGYPSQRGQDKSNWPKHYERFLEGDWPEDLEEPDWATFDSPFYICWPGDHTADYQFRASMRRYKAYFINELGSKIAVEVIK